MSYTRNTARALQGDALLGAVEATLAGASVTQLQRQFGLTRAYAAGLAVWAGPLCELYLGLVAGDADVGRGGSPAPDVGRSFLARLEPEPEADALTPPEEKLIPAPQPVPAGDVPPCPPGIDPELFAAEWRKLVASGGAS